MPSSKSNHLNMGWNFDNSYSKFPEHFFTRMSPIQVSEPNVVIINEALCQELGLNLQGFSKQYLAQLFSGNVIPEGAEPIAQAYAGHQFGHFTYLGDGRAHLIGEHITPQGLRVDIQFKGSGKTPYGRRGDGRAALGPMLREYIISEAMFALGIPTTRSLAVVTTGEAVYREKELQGAILTRVASSHIRVGTFEFFSARNDIDGLKKLADYTIERHYPDVKNTDHPYLNLLIRIIEKQADLIVHWMRVGFIHGVMNTDNMALSGETIDYGPCAFMDAYDPATVFSSIDSMGRYAYGNQPVIAQWNLARFAETLLPLLDKNSDKAVAMAEKAINDFPSVYVGKWRHMMRAKLGLFGENTDDELISDLLEWMRQHQADYTNTFLDLSKKERPKGEMYDDSNFQTWYGQWQARLKKNGQPIKSSLSVMIANNPAIIPRNHNVEHALDSAVKGDFTPFYALLSAIKEPYNDRPEIRAFQSPAPPGECVYQTFCGT